MADLTDRDYWDTAILRSAGRFLMLAALAERPRHGYDIARHIAQACGDCCDPSPAMIYPGIRDLTEAGLVACKVDDSGPRTRKVCSLTPRGAEALRVGAEAWADYIPALRRVVEAVEGPARLGASQADCAAAGRESSQTEA